MADQHWLERAEATRLYQWLRGRMNGGLIRFFRWTVLANQTGLRIAEVACGSGYGAHLLANEPNVALSLAADINRQDFEQASIGSYKAMFVLMDIFKPSLPEASFDFVWNSSSVEELNSPERAVVAMVWLAKPGGKVFVGVPNRGGPAGWLRRLPSHRMRAWLGSVYSTAELRALLISAGLEIETETSYLGGVFIGALGRKPSYPTSRRRIRNRMAGRRGPSERGAIPPAGAGGGGRA